MTDDEQGEISRSLQGDHEAFESLVRRYQRMIYALSYRMSGSAADAEDLTQEVFIRSYRELGNFRADAKFSSWLYRIAVNQCLNWRKRSTRREQIHQDWHADNANDFAADSETTSALAQQVSEALQKLHPKQRAAIVLTTYEGMNHAEAARVLGCSETTVSWRIFAGRSKLKRLLKSATIGGKHE